MLPAVLLAVAVEVLYSIGCIVMLSVLSVVVEVLRSIVPALVELVVRVVVYACLLCMSIH